MRDSLYLNLETSYSHLLMAQILDIFHPYVTHTKHNRQWKLWLIDVCLGYGEDQWLNIRLQLLDELNDGWYNYLQVFITCFNELYHSLCFSASPTPEQHWMSMPSTTILIAKRSSVIIHCLSIWGSVTCFPLWRRQEEFQHHQSLTFVHIHNNHYVMV